MTIAEMSKAIAVMSRICSIVFALVSSDIHNDMMSLVHMLAFVDQAAEMMNAARK